jgi:hypothetical protein
LIQKLRYPPLNPKASPIDKTQMTACIRRLQKQAGIFVGFILREGLRT